MACRYAEKCNGVFVWKGRRHRLVFPANPFERSSIGADSYLDDGHISLPVIVRAVSLADRVGLNDVKWQQILKTREHHEVETIVTLISHHNT
jgi:hypothetical protein